MWLVGARAAVVQPRNNSLPLPPKQHLHHPAHRIPTPGAARNPHRDQMAHRHKEGARNNKDRPVVAPARLWAVPVAWYRRTSGCRRNL